MRQFKGFLQASFLGLAGLLVSTGAMAQGPAAPAPTEPDHSSVVGSLGVGYLGASQVAIGVGGTTMTAPVVGVRYWLDPMLGLDLGLGLGMTSGKTKTSPANGPSETEDDPSFTAFIIHAGVPLSLREGKHYSFQIIPEANFGMGTGSAERGEADIDYSGMRFDIGARAGAELHFGFIGVPELSLQGSVGLQFITASAKTETKQADQKDKVEASATRLGTTVHDNPWNIFTTNVAALYYF